MGRTSRAKMRSLVVEVPDDGHIALLLSGNGSEGREGKVEVVLVGARRARVGDGDGHALAVVGVRQRDLAAAVRRLLGEVAVALGLCINNQ